MRFALAPLALLALSGPAAAQAAPSAPAAPAAAAAPAPAAEPQRTTATFGDWILRCVRPEKAPSLCEVGQVLLDKGQPVAQTAIGRPTRTEPLRLTVMVPINVQLTTPVRVTGSDNEPATAAVELSWRRCIPAGCIADAALTDEQLRRIRGRTDNGRVMFQDSTGRDATLPFGPRGLAQALDALAKEDQH
ncbi:MAG: hypothetical protein NVSMB18_21090 [Acetobacteraceae bacterium]